MLYLFVLAVIAVCNCHPYYGSTQYVCKESTASDQLSPQTSLSPYTVTVQYKNTHNLLVTINSEQNIPFTGFTLKPVTSPKHSNSQFFMFKDDFPADTACKSGQKQYKTTLLWTTSQQISENIKFIANVWYNSTTFWTIETTSTLPTDKITPDPMCGKTKACFSNCTKGDCDFIVSWIHDDKTVTFDIKTKVTPGTIMMSYAAVGLSTNQSMGGSSIMMCLMNGEMSAQLGYTMGHAYSTIPDMDKSLTFITGDTTGNIFHCTMKRTITSTSEKIFDLSKDWYLLFAHGNVSKGIPVHHEYHIASNNTMNFMAPEESDLSYFRETIQPDPMCGKTKACFSNCTKGDCDFIVSWIHDDKTVTFDIKTKVTPGTIMMSYAAVGLSTNQSMGGSSIIMCLMNGEMSAQLGYTIDHAYSTIPDTDKSLTFVTGDTTGNIFHCTIKRTITSTSGKIFDLSKDWYLLFAHGNVSKGVPVHHEYRVATNNTLNFMAPVENDLFHFRKEAGPITPDPWCGHLKGCFSNCTKSECVYQVSWMQLDNDTVSFEIETMVDPARPFDSWAAVGFSTNRSMDGSSIMMCLNMDNRMSAESGYTIDHGYFTINDPKSMTKFVSGEVDGNIFRCRMNRTIASTYEMIFDLKKEWYLLFAYGSISKGGPVHHTFRIASDKPFDFLQPLKIRDYIPFDPWCGRIKGCFMNCNKTECEYIVSWMHDDESVTFDIQTTVSTGSAINSWAAVGLSFDQEMPGSSIIMCMSDNGLMRAELGFTTEHTYSRINDLESSLVFINGSTTGNIFRCRVKRQIQTTSVQIFDLRDNWYLLFAHGNISKGVPEHHEFRTSTMTVINFLAPLGGETPASVKVNSIRPDPSCGKTKACYTNCTDTDCEYILSWTHDDATATFQIQTKVPSGIVMNSWAAIGLSSNQSMAGSSIMMCLVVDGKMTAEYGYTIGHAYSKLNDTQNKLKFVNGSTDGNVFRCAVQRDINLSTKEIFGLRNEWYLMFAQGNVSKGIPLHHWNKTVSPSMVDFLAVYEEPKATGTFVSIPPDSACGKTKACFASCTNNDCDYIISWTHDEKTATFDIQTKVTPSTITNSWAAIGLGSDPSMAQSSIMMCLVKNGTMTAEFGFAPGYYYVKVNDTQHTLKLVKSSTVGNILRCTVQRDIDASTDKIYSLRKKWYLLFANGGVYRGIPFQHSVQANSDSNIDFLAKIGDTYSLREPVYNIAETNQAVRTFVNIPPDSACGKTKACFTSCTNNDCDYIVSWTHDERTVTFDIQTKVTPVTISYSWAAIGFSSYPSMPQSSIMMCLVINGTVSAEFGYTPGNNYVKLNDTLKLVSSSTDGNILRCTVQRDIDASTDKIYSLQKKWYLLFAHGEVDGGIPMEHSDKYMSDSNIDFLAKIGDTYSLREPLYTIADTNQAFITLNSKCKDSKKCFHDCDERSCNYLVRWETEGDHVIFYIKTTLSQGGVNNAWVSIGFSPDGNMPLSSTMLCMSANGTITGHYGYTTEYQEYKQLDGITLPVTDGSIQDGIFHCTIKRPITSSNSHIFNLTEKWHIMLAHGELRRRGPPFPEYHTFRVGDPKQTDFLADQTDTTTTITPRVNSLFHIIEPDSECGKTKGCFHDCNATECSYLITWTDDSNDVTFKINAKVDGGSNLDWIAVGLSPDGHMPNSSFVMCLNVNGTFLGQYGYSNQYTQFFPVENGTILVLETSASGNIVRCTLKRPITSNLDKVFDLTKKWHVLFARGPVYVSGGLPQPSYHSFRIGGQNMIDFINKPDQSTTAPVETTVPGLFHIIEPDSECGKTKGCFHDCNATECSYLITWTDDSNDVTFTINAKVDGGSNLDWIAVGLSPDGHMPKSSFVMCLNANGTFLGQYGYSNQNTQYFPVENETIPVIESSASSNIVRCTLKRPITSNSDKIFDLTKKWYILFARGPVSVNGGLTQPSYHSFRVGGHDMIDFINKPDQSTTAPVETTVPGGSSSITPDNECGVTKGCYNDCNGQACTYLVTWTNDTSDVTFTMSAKVTTGKANVAWVGIGFSPDGHMPRSSTIMCMNAMGKFYGSYGYTTNVTEYVALENGSMPVMESSTAGDIVRCTIKRPISTISDRIFSLTKPWNILFAYGQVTVGKDGLPQPNYHDFRVGSNYQVNFLKISSLPTTSIPSSETTSPNTPGQITLDPECGKTKGCFPQCTGSVCSSLVTWQKDKDDIIFEIAEDVSLSPKSRWMAIGFSADTKMGDTSVIMCQHKDNGDMSVVLGYNDDKSFAILPMTTGLSTIIKDPSMEVNGQIMKCNFRRAVNSTDSKVFDLNSDWYILMGNGPIIGGSPTRHESQPISTSSAVDFQKFSTYNGGLQRSTAITIHGCLMVVAWILFSSIGIILARYFKKHWANSQLMKQKIWFQIHRTCMMLAVLCTIGGFILILVENKGYKELTETGDKSYVNYHPIFGIIVFSLALLNPIIAMCRCAPDHENRPIFNWFHSIVGTSAHILGAITVGFGINIPKAAVDSNANYVIIAYAIAFVVIEFLLARLSQENKKPDQKVFDLSGNTDNEGSEESSAMKYVLFLHVVAMVSSCVLLLYMILKTTEQQT